MGTPRSYLYVPGDRPDFLDKALQRGADALIVDLEDAVAPAGKEAARGLVRRWLDARAAGPIPQLWVRINPGTVGSQDIAAIGRATALYGVCLAKAESADDVRRVADALEAMGSDARVMPLLESARAVLDARSIAAAPRVDVLQLGEADLAVDTGIEPGPTGEEFAWCRSMVVLASAAAGISAPIAPVATDFRDLELLRASTEQLRRSGFFGRACIHPAQVPVANQVFGENQDAVARARALLDRAAELGTVTFAGPDGKMVDEAVLRAARRTLARG